MVESAVVVAGPSRDPEQKCRRKRWNFLPLALDGRRRGRLHTVHIAWWGTECLDPSLAIATWLQKAKTLDRSLI